jgi:hypothetical protein
MFLLTANDIQKQIDTLTAQLESEREMASRTADIYAAGTGYDRSVEATEKSLAELELHLACTLNEETYPVVDDYTVEPSSDELAAADYLLQLVNQTAAQQFGGSATMKGAWHVRSFINQIVEAIELRQRARKANDINDITRFTRRIEDLTVKLAKLIDQPLTIGDVRSSHKYRLHQHITIIQTNPNIRPVDLEAELDRRQFYFLRRVAVGVEVARLADVEKHRAARKAQFIAETRQQVAA